MIGELKGRYGITRPIWLMPILESALGIENASAIAQASKNVVALTIGLEDYTADLGVAKTRGRPRVALRAFASGECGEGAGSAGDRFGFWRRGRHGRPAALGGEFSRARASKAWAAFIPGRFR